MHNLGDVSSEELLARLRTHVGKGHVWQAGLIAYLAEVEHRNLHLEHACSSMWDFCVRKLGMSESESHRRIAAARVVQRFPLALEYLERGDVHLCAISALRHHLTPENHEELLREATGKSTRAVAEMIAARYPKPDVAACIEPVAPQTSLPIAPACAEQVAARVASESFGGSVQRIEPLSATRYRVELTISSDAKAKLERIRDLMSHRNPSGDLETILDASLDLLLEKLERSGSERPRVRGARTRGPTKLRAIRRPVRRQTTRQRHRRRRTVR